MGKLIYNSGLPEELRTNHFTDINKQWIDKINDPKCLAVVGAFIYLTSERLLTALSKKKMVIILSGLPQNHLLIKSSHPGSVNSYSGQEYTGITKREFKGLSPFNQSRLDKMTNFENTPIRFLLNESIEKINQNEWGQPMLHAKSFGLVGEDGIYEWNVGGHNPTFNGNVCLDSYTCIKRENDPDELEKHVDTWIDWLYESAVLDIKKSPDLLNVLQAKNKDAVIFQESWSKAHFTYSKYVVDEDVNFDDYFNVNEYCSDIHKYLIQLKNRQFIVKTSFDNNIPIGVDDKYREVFQKESTISSLKLREFFPVSEQKPKKALILHIKYRKKLLLHNSLKENFFIWLNKCPGNKNYKAIIEAQNDKIEKLTQQVERFTQGQLSNNGFNGKQKDLLSLSVDY
jgi:hypothetical protein